MYPNLVELLENLARDNDLSLLHADEFEWPANAKALEAKAAQLSPEHKEMLACGEHSDVMHLVRKYELRALHNFLERVFDGDLYGNFFED